MLIDRDRDENLQGRALYIFGGKNKVRKFVRKVVAHTLFEYFIMGVIFISSVTLAIENPLSDPDSALSKNLKIINMTMTFIFILEAVLKICKSDGLFHVDSSIAS